MTSLSTGRHSGQGIPRRALTHGDYTIACLCPMEVELAPVEAMLDEIHDPLPSFRDYNTYTLGRLGIHNIVVAVMPRIGNNSAATVATQLVNDFPSIRFGLLVGIGGGVPSPDGDDVRLGDVVVSQPTDNFGGVVQYDMGKMTSDGTFQRTGMLNRPPPVLVTSIERLKAKHRREGNNLSGLISDMLIANPAMGMNDDYKYPWPGCDQLFVADYCHEGGLSCSECDSARIVQRPARSDTRPRIHYGTIGSANMVVKDSITRDILRRDLKIICVDMEAAGVLDAFPCLVVRGICDYSDSHKNKRWQPYAAAVAAAYMKELLLIIPPRDVTNSSHAVELMQNPGETLVRLREPSDPHHPGIAPHQVFEDATPQEVRGVLLELVEVEPQTCVLDIVFIHDLNGHPEATWTYFEEEPISRPRIPETADDRQWKYQKLSLPSTPPNAQDESPSTICWPKDLIPITLPYACVLSYGYNSLACIRLRYEDAISRAAWSLLVALDAHRRRDPGRPLVFVAHGFGGLIAAELLRSSQNCEQNNLHAIYESTCGSIFFGTIFPDIAPSSGTGDFLRHGNKHEDVSSRTTYWLHELRSNFTSKAQERKWIVESFRNQNAAEDSSGSTDIKTGASQMAMKTCCFVGFHDVEYRKVAESLVGLQQAITPHMPTEKRATIYAEKRKQYLDLLHFQQIDSRHASIESALAKTCQWLLDQDEYQRWINETKFWEHHGFLWIKGKPAAGKSTIMKYALAETKKRGDSDLIVSFFFNARGEDLEKSTVGLYRSLLMQLFQELPELQVVLDVLDPISGEPQTLQVPVLQRLLGDAIQNIGPRSLTCFIDALDECPEDEVRNMVLFLEELAITVSSSKTRLLICFSSRHYPHISIEKGLEIVLESQTGHDDDVATYLATKLRAGGSAKAEDLRKEILKRASGVFLWVVLVVPMLNKAYDRGNIRAMRQRLSQIPNDLYTLFSDILKRDQEDIDQLLLCLQWILYAKRPLKCQELYYAITTELEPENANEWDPEEITDQDMKRFLLSASKGLADTTTSEHQRVQFIHESVRDFLLKGGGFQQIRADVASDFAGASHERLKRCCQEYIRMNGSILESNFSKMGTAPRGEAARLRRHVSRTYPFLQYAVSHVLDHADAAEGYGISQTSFIEEFPFTVWVKQNNFFENFRLRRYTTEASRLYIFASKDLRNLIRTQLRYVKSIDIPGERYSYPIIAAIARGNKSALEALLCVSNSHSSGIRSHENKHHLSAKQQEAVIESLLEMKERFPSSIEEETSHGVKNEPYTVTLMYWAVNRGDDHLAKALLHTGKVQVDFQDLNSGRTPLSLAAERNSEEMARLLLTHGANCNHPDREGRTALSYAAEEGNFAIVKLLVNTKEVDVDQEDHRGLTPLSYAAAAGHYTVVRLLIYTGRTNVNSRERSDKQWTPMMYAIDGGHEKEVNLFLETGKVDTLIIDSNGMTALILAASRGHANIVRRLLSYGEDDVRATSAQIGSSLLVAAEGGHSAALETLLAYRDQFKDLESSQGLLRESLQRTDHTGLGLLHVAVGSGSQEAVELLLSTGEMDVNARNISGITPLEIAATSGNAGLVVLLLVTGKASTVAGRHPGAYLLSEVLRHVDRVREQGPSRTDNHALQDYQMQLMLLEQQNKKRLMMARQEQDQLVEGREQNEKTEVKETHQESDDEYEEEDEDDNEEEDEDEDEDDDDDDEDKEAGEEESQQKNQEAGDKAGDEEDLSQIHLPLISPGAAENVLQVLMTLGKVEADVPSTSEYTPLQLAAYLGQTSIARMLIMFGKATPDAKNKANKTALRVAIEMNSIGVAYILLSTGEVDLESQADDGSSPLSLAALGGGSMHMALLDHMRFGPLSKKRPPSEDEFDSFFADDLWNPGDSSVTNGSQDWLGTSERSQN